LKYIIELEPESVDKSLLELKYTNDDVPVREVHELLENFM
jgi:hypothetical protein